MEVKPSRQANNCQGQGRSEDEASQFAVLLYAEEEEEKEHVMHEMVQ